VEDEGDWMLGVLGGDLTSLATRWSGANPPGNGSGFVGEPS